MAKKCSLPALPLKIIFQAINLPIMPLYFSLPNYGRLPMEPGMPPGFEGPVIRNSSAQYIHQDFGQIVVQEISNLHYTLRYNACHLFQKVKLNFSREEAGLQTTAILQDECYATISGAGRFRIREGYFASLYTDAWQGVLKCKANALLNSFDTTWTDHFLQEFLPQENIWRKVFPRQFPDIPAIIGHPYRRITPTLHELIWQLIRSSYDETLREPSIDHLLKEYLIEVLQEIDNPYWLQETISKTDIEKIEAAKQLIAHNPFQHLPTKTIARQVILNECKLKALFIKATGMGTFDYMMYLRCLEIRDKIRSSDLPIKSFIQESGYCDLAALVNGFKRHMGCTPTEVRGNKLT